MENSALFPVHRLGNRNQLCRGIYIFNYTIDSEGKYNNDDNNNKSKSNDNTLTIAHPIMYIIHIRIDRING